jgi:hypothetical protein
VLGASFFEAEPIPQAVLVQHATALAFRRLAILLDFCALAASKCKKQNAFRNTVES